MEEQPLRTFSIRVSSAITALVLAACSSNGGGSENAADHDAADEDVAQIESALSAGDICGEQCGGVALAPGNACCRNGAETAYDVASQCCTSAGVQPKHPIQDLDECPSRVRAQNPTTEPVNGCSTQAGLVAALPNAAFLSAAAIAFYSNVFEAECDDHDECYGTCNEAPGTDDIFKAQCDTAFLVRMRQQCFSRFSNPVARAGCLRAAQGFHRGVRLLANPLGFYPGAQSRACDCCAGDASCTTEDADLSVTPVAIPPDAVAPGDPVQFQFYVNNQGPGAATDVSASIDFTAGLSQPSLLVHAPGSGSVPCSVVALTSGGNLATCTVPRLEFGDTATIDGSATTIGPGQEAAFVSVSALQIDPDQFDNAAEATWVVECPAGLTWDPASSACGCPSGSTECNGQCVSQCTGGEVLDPATCTCSCPTGLTWDPIDGQCASCSGLGISPTTGIPGTEVFVTGSGYVANEVVVIYFDGTPSGGSNQPGSPYFDHYFVPSVASGTFRVDVIGSTSGTRLCALFTVP